MKIQNMLWYLSGIFIFIPILFSELTRDLISLKDLYSLLPVYALCIMLSFAFFIFGGLFFLVNMGLRNPWDLIKVYLFTFILYFIAYTYQLIIGIFHIKLLDTTFEVMFMETIKFISASLKAFNIYLYLWLFSFIWMQVYLRSKKFKKWNDKTLIPFLVSKFKRKSKK